MRDALARKRGGTKMQKIQSQDIAVADVFKDFYVVPDYQRDYVWETPEVEQLLTDINAELSGNDPSQAPEYFIGSIVVCPDDAGVLELIDGQQRMTTLYLTLCAIRDRISALGEPPPGAIELQIASPSVDANGEDLFRYTLDLQYDDSGDILVSIAKGETLAGVQIRTRSIADILNAYQVCTAFLVREFGDDGKAVRVFYGYLTKKVKLIRIQTENVAKALKIFETINDRGIGLNSMDLLKNLLFMKASRQQFDKLKTIWKDLQDTIFDAGEKPLRFLRYFIFSRYEVDVLREDEIYGWFARNEKLCGYSQDPLLFAKHLLEGAVAYRNFLDGKNQNGAKNRYLENMRLLGGKAARQHLILLLAGRHLPLLLFERLCREVENLFFVYVITREPTRDFERAFAKWAVDLRKVQSDDDLNTFLTDRFVSAKANLAARFDDAMRRLSADMLQQYRLRYVLAKLTQFVDLEAYGETAGTCWLSRYTSGDLEIEHIFPQDASAQAASEFGPIVDEKVVGRLGNLVLAEKSINASLGNRAYSEKCVEYPKSQLLLTRALATEIKVGANTKIDSAAMGLKPFETWNSQTITERQQMLTSLAHRVWDIAHSKASV
jgi:hypothetical protein